MYWQASTSVRLRNSPEDSSQESQRVLINSGHGVVNALKLKNIEADGNFKR